MNYLLDTCVVSELIKIKPHEPVIQWIKEAEERNLYVSVLTLGELKKGICRLNDLKKKFRLLSWLEQEFLTRFDERLIPVSKQVASQWGEVQAACELRGKPLPVIDGLLASTAMTHHLCLVSRNEGDFAPTGVDIVNPWAT